MEKQGKSEPRKTIEFKYRFSEDYNPVYANGAAGGITPKGELVINFFLERSPIPYAIVNELTEDGTIGGELERKPERDKPMLLRFVSTGVVLNYQSAKDIHQWLGKHLEIMEAAKERKSGKTPKH